jgi:poly(3-hydroxybutyrate) depolymerase
LISNSINFEVEPYTVRGGGRAFPQPDYRFPRFPGPTNRDLESAGVIWEFFRAHPQR